MCILDHMQSTFFLPWKFPEEISRRSMLTHNILHTNIMYLKASADVKISTFFEKNGRGDHEAADHEMDL